MVKQTFCGGPGGGFSKEPPCRRRPDPYDAILIPGGGLIGTNDVPLWVQRRLDRAIALYRGECIIALSAGTTHKPPPLDENGFPVYESVVSSNYLIEKGIDAGKIRYETSSYDTVGNAYFSKVIHVDPMGFKKLLIITSAFHMPRTRAIFEWVYGLDSSPGGPYNLYFEEVSDQGMEKNLLKARIEREKHSLGNVLTLKKEIRTFREFHRWLFGEHGAYALSVEPGQVEDESLDTY